MNEVRQNIRAVCAEISEFLVEKNEKYGNSALDPVRIFSRSSVVEQLLVRIDDKISRLAARGRVENDDDDEDTVKDLLGYLVLLLVARRMSADLDQELKQACPEPKGWDACIQVPRIRIPGVCRLPK
jgi:hypothetical protein